MSKPVFLLPNGAAPTEIILDGDSRTEKVSAAAVVAAFAACKSLPLAMLDRADDLDAAEFVDNAEAFMQAMRHARAALAQGGAA